MTASHDCEFNRQYAPGEPLVPHTVLQDRYRIVRQLGRGGMGAVYEAIDQRLEKTVALKETLSSEPSTRKQFEREARLLASMQHPALPQVSDHFVEGSRAFLVMQFIGGVDLAKIISQQPGPFPRNQVIAWADQLLDALIYLHSRDRQVIHRDIKPHNLKLTATGQIALLDFGLAKAQASDPSITTSQAFFGYTRHYAPLEQIQDRRTDPRSDIYALGATLYHLLTGIKPPDAMVRATVVLNGAADPLLPAHQIHAAVGPQISAILNKAMAQNPGERYANAGEFREALRRMGRTKDETAKRKSDIAAAAVALSANRKIHISDLPLPHVTESPAPNMALVGSARRFGPAGATAILAVIIMLAAGILYGSGRWFPTDKLNQLAPATTSDTAAALRQSEGARKAKSNLEPSVSDRSAEKRTDLSVGTQLEKKPVLFLKPPAVRGRTPERANNVTRKTSQRPGVPSIRLPNPEFRDNAPALSPSSNLRSYSVSRDAVAHVRHDSANTPPRFCRASDG